MLRFVSRHPLRIILSIIILIPAFIIILVIASDMHTHNTELEAVATFLDGIPLPSHTYKVSQNAHIFVRSGASGKACDYIAEKTLQTTSTRTEIATYYHATSLSPTSYLVKIDDPAQYYSIDFDFRAGYFVGYLIIPDQSENNDSWRFTLQSVESRSDAGLDIRCF